MIKSFVDSFMKNKDAIRECFSEKHPESYQDIVRIVISFMNSGEYDQPDADRIHIIDDGAYQGTLVFVIGSRGYQPDTYWYVMVAYGSCSGCDTFQAINDYCDDGKPTEQQVNDYMTLALHIVQNLRRMYE